MEQMRKSQKTIRDVFDRIPYSTPLTAEYLHIHGYPYVEDATPGQIRPKTSFNVIKWRKTMDLLAEHFQDEYGNKQYIIHSSKFFFPTEDDAHLFRSLLLLI